MRVTVKRNAIGFQSYNLLNGLCDRIQFLKWDDTDGKSTFWHSTAHLMAEAVDQQLDSDEEDALVVEASDEPS